MPYGGLDSRCVSDYLLLYFTAPLSSFAQILVRACISQDILIFLIRYYFSVAGPGYIGCWGLGVGGEGHVQQPESPHKHRS
jgi:hypothetical protein